MSNPVEEGYVSFETAKLLKDKGFNYTSPYCYEEKGINDIFFVALSTPLSNTDLDNTIEPHKCYSAPTLQTAKRWLRKVHHYYIQVMLDSWFNGGHSGYYVLIQKTDSKFEMRLSDKVDKVFYNEPEEACEAAIKYCLENLI